MNIKYIFSTLFFMVLMSGFVGCSEDDIKIDESLGEPLIELPRGEPGSVDEMIYKIFERYGTYVLYKFDEQTIRQKWTGGWSNWYVPVKEGNEEYIRKMVNFLQEEFLDGYTDEFVRKNLAHKIFLVDSLDKYSEYSEDLMTFASSDYMYVISNVGEAMDDFDEADWYGLKNEIVNTFTQSFYGSAEIKPTKFLSLAATASIIKQVADPEGEYEKGQHSAYLVGYVHGKALPNGGYVDILKPTSEQDFADYITFLTTNTKAELTNVLTRYSKMRERALALVPYLKNVLELDVIATQNKNCPEDPVSPDFFEQF